MLIAWEYLAPAFTVWLSAFVLMAIFHSGIGDFIAKTAPRK